MGQYDTSLHAKNRGTRSGKVEFIVLHDTAGGGSINDAKYLANDPEHRGISVDFCVVKDGTVYQLNQDLKGHCTFHAGRHTSFRGRLNGAVNQHSVGIEIAQKAEMQGLEPAYPDVQVRAVAQVCRDLCVEFGLRKEDITTHTHIITDGSRSDPRQFPWSSFWAYFNQGSETDNGQGHLNAQTIHTVQAGETLWGLANRYSTTVEKIKALNGMNTPETVITVGQNLIVKE